MPRFTKDVVRVSPSTTPFPISKYPIIVGDSPEGHLKNRGGGSCLKLAKNKNKTHLLLKHTHRARPTPRWPPRPTGVAQSKAPSSRFRLARGLTPPSSGFHLAQGPTPPSSGFRLARGPTPPLNGFHLARGLTPPSSGFRLARGPAPPSSRFRLARGLTLPRSRLPHKRTCSRTRVRAFNALTQQSRAIARLGITHRRCSANSLEEAHPRHCRGLCDMASVSSVALCRPLPYGLTRCTLEGGPIAPSNSSLVNLQGQTMMSGRREPSPPLLVLCGRPRPCSATPGTATTTPMLLSVRGQGAATPATVPRTDHR
jgi:hypothetical protein